MQFLRMEDDETRACRLQCGEDLIATYSGWQHRANTGTQCSSQGIGRVRICECDHWHVQWDFGGRQGLKDRPCPFTRSVDQNHVRFCVRELICERLEIVGGSDDFHVAT